MSRIKISSRPNCLAFSPLFPIARQVLFSYDTNTVVDIPLRNNDIHHRVRLFASSTRVGLRPGINLILRDPLESKTVVEWTFARRETLVTIKGSAGTLFAYR